MRAVVVSDNSLHVVDHPDPVPGLGQVLVRVRAAGVNAADLAQAAGRYPAPPDAPRDIPGLELAGEIVAVGPGVIHAAEGDRVMALVGGGGHAELAAVHEGLLLPIPDGVDWEAAGGFVEAFATAHDALFTQARLGPGERVLVQGAAGGVGVAAVQLAEATGATVVATVRTETGRSRVAALGAEVVAPGEADGPFNVVLELVGGENLSNDLSLLELGGRLVVIGVAAGNRSEIDFLQLMTRRASIHASTLRARPLAEKIAVVRELERHVLPLLESGRLLLPIEATFALEEVQAAYDRFATSGKFGKIVLRMSDSE